MTQIAFLRKAELPSNAKIQDLLQSLGYDFRISGRPDAQLSDDGLDCIINGREVYFETCIQDASQALEEHDADWIMPDLTNQGTAVSFIWGADFRAGAAIGLISIALMDLSHALVYYMDDQLKYTRDGLIEDANEMIKEMVNQ